MTRTEEQVMCTKHQDLISYLKDNLRYAQVESWYEDDGAFGVSITDDGATQTGFFDEEANLIGDWF